MTICRCRTLLVLGTGITCLYVAVFLAVIGGRTQYRPNVARLLDMLPRLRPTDESCSAIFSGDYAAIRRAKVLDVRDPVQLSAVTKNCNEFKRSRGYMTECTSAEEESYPVAYSVLMYKDPEQVERLLRAIYRVHNIYCIHVDASAGVKTKDVMLALAGCFDNVFLARDPVAVKWASFSVVEAELLCMKQLLETSSTWKYLINLTGQEFPLKTNLDIVRILKALNGSNVVSIAKNFSDTERWSSHLPTPGNVSVHKGPTHALLTRPFVQYVVYNKTAVDFANWLRKTKVPDETFLPSLNHSPHLQVPGSYTGLAKRDVNGYLFIARFKKWYSDCSGRLVRDVCVFGVGDLPVLSRAYHLFANKFYVNLQPMTLRCLEELHYNKTRDDITGTASDRLNMTFYRHLPNVKHHIPSGLETFVQS